MTSAALRRFHAGGQVSGYWIGQSGLATLDHVGQQKRGEYFGHGVDLEDRFTVHRPRIALVHAPVGDDSDVPATCVDPIGKNFADFGVRRD